MAKLRYFGLTDPGRVRQQNEDNWFADPEEGTFIVSDGMGGQFAGALASKIVVEVLPSMLRQRLQDWSEFPCSEAAEKVRGVLADLSEQIRQKTEGQPALEGMGATVVFLLVKADKALLAHMGDSRAYLLRKRRLERLTKDHSVVRLLIESGDITPAQAHSHPAHSQLTQFVGMKGEPLPEAHALDLNAGDRLLLCTDGLTGMVSDAGLHSILSRRFSPKEACRRLIAAANAAGGKDNITGLIVSLPRSLA